MADRQKLMDGLEHCMKGPKGCQTHCPYKMDFGCRATLASDAYVMLKTQEPVSVEERLVIDKLLNIENYARINELHWMADGATLAVTVMRLLRGEITTLKAQEPVEPKMMEFVDKGVTWEKYEVPTCGVCGALLGDALFCPMCGRAVKRNG